MEYGTLIRQAWTITWRYRFLWLLGVLAGGAVGMPSLNGGGGGGSTGWRTSPGDVAQVSPSLAAAGEQIAAWAAANVGLLIVSGLAVAGIALVLFALSFIAQGSMAQATADLATGHPSSLGQAWGSGVHLFWRYVGLWLVLVGAAMVVAAVIGGLVAAVAFQFVVSDGQTPLLGLAMAATVVAAVVVSFVLFVLRLTRNAGVPRWLVAVGAALFALPLFTVLIVVGLTVSIVVAFAQRAIAIEDVGPIEALRSGWHLTRDHLGDSLLTWLVNVGLALATGIAVVMGVLGALVLLGGIGALVVAIAGFGAPTVAYIGLSAALFLAGVLTLAGIANTFFWTFWTLVYLRLSGRTVTTAFA